MADVKVSEHNEAYIKIDCEMIYRKELKEEFSFYAKNYIFHPKYKAGIWDGRISLLKEGRFLPKGLLARLIKWAEHNRHKIDYQINPDPSPNFSADDVLDLFEHINAPYPPYEVQVDAVQHMISNARTAVIAPTSGGKSYIIHGLCSYHALNKRKVLVLVDRAQLVEQLRTNLAYEYGGDKMFKYGTVYDRNIVIDDVDVYFTTWQSCYENPPKWFEQFDVLVGDEIHKFKAKSIVQISENCSTIEYRHGLTATIDNQSKTDRLTITGIFGEPKVTDTLEDLLARGDGTPPRIYVITINYDQKTKDLVRDIHSTYDGKEAYAKEEKLIESDPRRLRLIASITESLQGNTLVAFKHRKHGRELEQLIGQHKKPMFFVDSTVPLANRMQYSDQMDQSDEMNGIVSLGTFSTGISIKKIHNIISACLMKSWITVPQLLGRGIRKAKGKTHVNFIDVGDDLSFITKKEAVQENYSLAHFKERITMYEKLGLKVIRKNLNIEDFK